MSKLRVLVTGPGGRIGPHILPTFREAYSLRTLDKNGVPDDPDAIIADLSNLDTLTEAMQDIDVVVHLAAQSDEAAFEELLVPNNIIGLHNVYEAAHKAGVRRIVFASTCQTMMGYGPSVTVDTSDPVRPITMYAATKVFGEVLGRYYHDQRGMEFVGVRIGWFQPYDSPLLRNNHGTRDYWLSPQDCTGILQAAIEKPLAGYTLVYATSITIREALSRRPARELLGYESQDDVRLIPMDIPEVSETAPAP